MLCAPDCNSWPAGRWQCSAAQGSTGHGHKKQRHANEYSGNCGSAPAKVPCRRSMGTRCVSGSASQAQKTRAAAKLAMKTNVQ